MRLVLACVVLLLMVAAPAAAESLHLRPLDPARTAGPQKQISYSFEVTNLEDQAVDVIFEVVDQPDHDLRDWIILAPETIRLDPNDTATAVAVISTPFENGYNKGKATFMLRATPVAPGTDDAVGEPELIELSAGVKGWYTPGPSFGLLAGALACAAFAFRCRR